MSADNWAQCPRCVKRHEKALREGAARVAEAYGKVPLEEWDRMRDWQSEAESELIRETFREDYEFYGAEDGEVVASYSGSCSECGLSLSFTDRHPIEGVDE